MKVTKTLTLLLIMLDFNPVIGQSLTLSKHEFSVYINEVKKSVGNAEISIITSGDTIKGNKVEGFYYFPIIDTTTIFDIRVKVKNIIFLGQGYKSWVLNRGSKIVLGKLTKLNKLLSVAEYNSMAKNDKDWASYSKRFFVIDHAYTLDIDNRDKIKKLQFLIISPSNSNSIL